MYEKKKFIFIIGGCKYTLCTLYKFLGVVSFFNLYKEKKINVHINNKMKFCCKKRLGKMKIDI